MGGHPQIEDGKVRYVFNPLVNDVSEESVMLKEGCRAIRRYTSYSDVQIQR